MNIIRKLFARKSAICCMQGRSKIHPSGNICNLQNNPSSIKLGDHTHIRGELLVFRHGGRICMGDFCYLGEGARIWSSAEVIIGNRVLISHLVSIYDNTTHPLRADLRHKHYRDIINSGHPVQLKLGERPVRIENDVWIGSHCVILRGVTIGRGAVVGAGSIVTKSVAKYTLVAGNPARVIRQLEEPPQDFTNLG